MLLLLLLVLYMVLYIYWLTRRKSTDHELLLAPDLFLGA